MKEELKMSILLFYYNRPRMVQWALRSVFEQDYSNWEMVIIDDSDYEYGDWGSISCNYPHGWEDYFVKNPKVSYIRTNDTLTAKSERQGSNFGRWANAAMLSSDADIVLCLCDDDGLLPGYLSKLNQYYSDNPEVMYSYCHFTLFDPLQDQYEEVMGRTTASNYLAWEHDLNPYCQIDSSQGSWRREPMCSAGVRFPHPQTANLDASIYTQMFGAFGNCKFNGILGAAKGWDYGGGDVGQLGKRPNPYLGTE